MFYFFYYYVFQIILDIYNHYRYVECFEYVRMLVLIHLHLKFCLIESQYIEQPDTHTHSCMTITLGILVREMISIATENITTKCNYYLSPNTWLISTKLGTK
jgi:hypothetical protein